jgi:hypothetical protein
MSRTVLHSFVLAALATIGGAALADPPAVVGRISNVQGQVTIVGEGEPAAAILNWPVSNADHISTSRGGRAEFRVGSTAVRVDGDSDLEITDLDDDLLRLRLNYGSVIVRVKNPDMLRDFELSTPHARVTLIEPGEIRVDADRTPDTTQVSVLAGSARVDGAGASMTVANGRKAEVSPDSVRTMVAARDYFDIWAQTRDREDDASVSTRYIPAEVTGYEELDRNGTWRETAEYGAVWTPRTVAVDWAPYRDGQWIWRDPWGWTWVDNAPWGYAPSHYGRWVLVDRRWCWAPGRIVGRPVWAPALVGWVGGTQLQVNVGNRGRAPGLGWYPLGPRDHYVPPYRVSVDHERRLTWTHNGREERRDERRDDYRDHRDHRDGVTVLPRDQFEARHRVQVNKGPGVILAPSQVPAVTQVAAPQPAGPVRVTDSYRGNWQDRRDRDNRGQQQTHPSVQLQTQTQAPVQAQPVAPVINDDRNNNRNDRGRFADDVRRQQRQETEVREQWRRDQAQRDQSQRAVAPQQQMQVQQQQVQQQQAQQQAQREQAQREQAQREQARAQQQAQQQHWQEQRQQQEQQRQMQHQQQMQQQVQQQQPQPRPAPVAQPQPQPQPQAQPHDPGRTDQRKEYEKRKEEGRDKNQNSR